MSAIPTAGRPLLSKDAKEPTVWYGPDKWHPEVGTLITFPGRDPFEVLAQVARRLGLAPEQKTDYAPGREVTQQPPPRTTGAPTRDSAGVPTSEAEQNSRRREARPSLPPGNAVTPSPSPAALQCTPQAQDAQSEAAKDKAPSGGDDSGGAGEREGRVHHSTSVSTSPARAGVRDASMAAYRALQWSGTLTKQQKVVLDVFLKDPARDWTRQELVNAAGFPINVICGRVNELLKEPCNLLVELDDKRECSVTRNRVNALVLATVANG